LNSVKTAADLEALPGLNLKRRRKMSKNMSNNNRGGNRRGGEETYRVAFLPYEVEELRDLLRDEDGDADEDVLDDIREALGRGGKREIAPEERLVLRLTRKEKDACRRAIDDKPEPGDDVVLAECIVKTDYALAKRKA
jgi:hypothetical protein